MNTDWLRTFLVAGQSQNFHEAAASLYVSQSTVSLQVQHLEEEIGVKLFRRVGRNVVLTAAGAEFLPYARTIVETLDRAQRHFKDWRHGSSGHLAIAASALVAGVLLPELVSKFVSENPDIDVMTKVFHSYEVPTVVVCGQADLGLCRIRPVRPDLRTSVVFTDRMVLAASPRDVDASYKALIASHRMLVYSHPIWEQVLVEFQALEIPVNVMNVSHVEVTKRFVAQGLGVSFLPHHAIIDEVRRGELVEIPAPGLSKFKDEVYLLTPGHRQLFGPALLFREFVEEELARIGSLDPDPASNDADRQSDARG